MFRRFQKGRVAVGADELQCLLVFGVFGLVIRVFGYQIANDGREELFLIMYIISNVLYYPIMQEVLHGKTLAKKFIFR